MRVRADAEAHDFRQAEHVEAVDEQCVGDAEEELVDGRWVKSGHEQPYVPHAVGCLQALLFPYSDRSSVSDFPFQSVGLDLQEIASD